MNINSDFITNSFEGRKQYINIKDQLHKLNIIPTLDQANQIFWGLKDNWWKQIIDGKDHKFGSEVYDKGLHGGHVEPGYLNNIKNACQYAFDRFNDPISFDLYQSIHHIACNHFRGKTTTH